MFSYLQVLQLSSSYLHSLQSGIPGKNWPEVANVLESYHPEDFKKSKTMVPVSVCQPEMLKRAFTKPWTRDCGLPFALWVTEIIRVTTVVG